MNEFGIGLGIFAILAAVTGGGLKALGYEIHAISSLWRQAILAALGATIIAAAMWDDIYPIINPVQTVRKTIGPITLEGGAAHTIPVMLPHGGTVELVIQNLRQDWTAFAGARGEPGQDSLYVGVCASQAEMPCEKSQMQTGQILFRELPPGGANISLFNFATSPRTSVTLSVAHPGDRKFDIGGE